MEVIYTGEHLFAGQLGHFLAILAFVAALFSCISYFFSTQNDDNEELSQSWKGLARIGFILNAVSILGIVVILFTLILNHKFEYHYVWAHSSTELPLRFMLSCFWEGQEGSFLLWAFWHAILGFVVILTGGKYEAPVMAVLGLTQFYLASMLLGIYFFDYKVGSSPFILLRDFMHNAPIFQRADYLNFIADGNGLNPLLQNYWMTIHPPTLFLGFASTLLPFAYVIAGLWKRDYSKEWTLHTLNWSLFSGGILGLGILMGAAWAYEALSFGGFWAWDPVENASLVPWLTLVAALHMLVIYRHTGHSLKGAIFLFIATFILILYSTFLTRSGILGDTSVHAFTDLGMSGQLLVYIFLFLIPAVLMLMFRWQSIPSSKNEEKLMSREFWMFIGAVLITIVSVFITYDTSLPVINTIFGTDMTITDPITRYNSYSIWFAILILLGAGLIQFMRYKNDDTKRWIKQLALALLVSLVFTAFTAYFMEIKNFVYLLLLFSSYVGIFTNIAYIVQVVSKRFLVWGPSIAHAGFALIILGILLSAGRKEVISINTLNIDYGENFDDQNRRENILLQKDRPVKMERYEVTYLGDSVVEPNIYYKVQYEDQHNGDKFVLLPNAQINPKMGLIASPDTRHYLSRDVYTHVSQVPKRDIDPSELSTELHTFNLAKGDSSSTKRFSLELKNFNPSPSSIDYIPQEGDIAVGAVLEAYNGIETFNVEPVYYIRQNQIFNVPATVPELGLTINFTKIDPASGVATLEIQEQETIKDYIIMKAIVFPYINVLWLGCLMMVAGFIISMFRRRAELRRANQKVLTT